MNVERHRCGCRAADQVLARLAIFRSGAAGNLRRRRIGWSAQGTPPEPGDEMEEIMAEEIVEQRKEPVLKLKFLSHGTLESADIDKSRRFYEEFLGLEVVQTSKISLMIRLGNTNTIAVVYSPRRKAMTMLNHNGLDVATREEV